MLPYLNFTNPVHYGESARINSLPMNLQKIPGPGFLFPDKEMNPSVVSGRRTPSLVGVGTHLYSSAAGTLRQSGVKAAAAVPRPPAPAPTTVPVPVPVAPRYPPRAYPFPSPSLSPAAAGGGGSVSIAQRPPPSSSADPEKSASGGGPS